MWSVGSLVALAALSYALYVYLQPPALPEGIVYGNGWIEATNVRVSSEVPGRVTQSDVVEGRAFRRGDLLLQIDDADLQLRLAQARADRLALSESRKRMLAAMNVAGHHTVTAETNADRYRALAGTGVASQQQRDVAENTLREAQGLLRGSQATVVQIDAQIAAADKGIALLQDQVARCRVTAPTDGTILLKMVERGEVVAVGQLLAVMADLRRLEVKIYVSEADLGRMKLQGAARIGTNAFPDHYTDASIERIDEQAQFTPRDIHMPDERARTVFGVTLAVVNRHDELKPGMPVDAWVKWRDDTSWPAHLVVPR